MNLENMDIDEVAATVNLREMTKQKDAAYLERNRCVALIARMAMALGYRAAVTRTAIEGWTEDWHGCVYVFLPTGQVSWHFHDSQAGLFEGIPTEAVQWDGHSTGEKYARVDFAFRNKSPLALTLNELAIRVHAANIQWWVDLETGEPKNRNKGELLALIHSEISEALEGERKGLMDDKLPHRKMAEVELADAVIRILDYVGGFNYDLQGAFDEKMAYNATRVDHTHEARKAAGGKKF